MLFGAHVSVSDGYVEALDYAQSVGCECGQIFAKSPRQWNSPPLLADAAAAFRLACADRDFGPTYTHTAYLINLATADPVIRGRSIEALADELGRGTALGASGIVTHVGSDRDGPSAKSAHRVAAAIVEAFEMAGESAVSSRVLLENTAGAGKSFGTSFAELGACIELSGLPAERIGVCFDTCHGFAHGYPVHTAEGWAEVLSLMDEEVGLDRLGLIHANDCLFPQGSRRDRHAWVGDGFIGVDGFRAMVCSDELSGVCACIEVAGEKPEKDRVNLARLKALRDSCG